MSRRGEKVKARGNLRNRVHVCVDDPTPVPDANSTCELRELHTPNPIGYGAWFDWAETMAETHVQVECPGCGRLAIWAPKCPTCNGVGVGRWDEQAQQLAEDEDGGDHCSHCGGTGVDPDQDAALDAAIEAHRGMM